MKTLQMEKRINKPNLTSKIYIPALSIILTVSSFICLLSILAIPCSNTLVAALSVLVPAALSYLLYGTTGKYINMVLPILLAVYFAAAYRIIWNGFLIIANSVITKFNRINGLGILSYKTDLSFSAYLSTTMALIPLIMILAYLIVISIKHRLFLPVILLTLPFIFTCFYFHEYAALPAAVIIVVAWAVIISNSLFEKTISLRTTAWLLAVTAFFGIFTCLVIPYNKYTPSQKTNSVKQRIANRIENLRYNYGIKKVPIDVLPNGDLQNAKTLSYTDEVVMKVKMQKPSSVYLKGFVGSVYGSNRWSSLPAAAYGGEYTGLFYWLAKNNFYPQSQFSSLCGVNPQLSSSCISINNIALKSKYIYTPYEAAPTQGLSPQNVNYREDTGISSSGLLGTRNYSFSMYSPLSADYGIFDMNKWVKDNIGNNKEYAQYLKNENAYRAFVYKNYLEVPAQTKKTLERYFSKKTIDSLANKDYSSVVDFLRRYYLQKFTYSPDIKKLPANSDFIANFLKTGSGYDVHFATLSVMLLRSAGIPARYVEGYYLSHNYVDIYSKTENATLDVKDSFAHAWAEIYVDELGWIPAELTPGYYNASKDISKNTGKDESVSSKDKNFYNDQQNALTNDSAAKHNNPKINTELIRFFLVTAAALFVIIALITAAIYIIKAKRKKSFVQSANAKAALKMYIYAAKLIKFDGINIDRHCASESADGISEKYDQLTGMSWEQFLNLVYKARFGAVEPEKQELSFMQSYIKSLAKKVYANQSFVRKLILKLSGLS